jgi:ATP-dependent Lhr-like helicase
MTARDLPAPSPLAGGVLNAAPYAFLDDAPLEERRTQAVQSRRWAPQGADEFGALDPDAIAAVREEAWPEARDADEMHEALMTLGFVSAEEAAAHAGWKGWLDALARQHRATQLVLSHARPGGAGQGEGSTSPSVEKIWVAAERLPMWHALHPAASMQPAIEAPAEYAAQTWAREDVIRELLRARLGGLGPIDADMLARDLGVARSDIDIALANLQAQGVVMQGHFCAADQWCERHLLARIHRYTIGKLRREIEPVARRDFMRFLFDWQRVTPGAQVSGPEALAGILLQLEGYEIAAGAWESEVLPARVADYSIGWLDDLVRAGRVVWARLGSGTHDPEKPRSAGPLRTTPITLLPRRTLAGWMTLANTAGRDVALSSRAQAIHDLLRERGASFFDELMADAHLLRSEVEDALGELVAVGAVNADSFSGLRALLMPAAKKQRLERRHLLRNTLTGIEDAGRWALVRRAAADGDTTAMLEHVARVLLRRYGVVGWRLLEREASWLPPWRELRRVYQRLEARGEIRGGRFIDGLVGEQFALPEAVELLRQVRRRPHDGTGICISGADPLNLVGTVLAGNKVPALATSRILYRDGVAIAALVAGKFTPLVELDSAATQAARRALLRLPRAEALPLHERA